MWALGKKTHKYCESGRRCWWWRWHAYTTAGFGGGICKINHQVNAQYPGWAAAPSCGIKTIESAVNCALRFFVARENGGEGLEKQGEVTIGGWTRG